MDAIIRTALNISTLKGNIVGLLTPAPLRRCYLKRLVIRLIFKLVLFRPILCCVLIIGSFAVLTIPTASKHDRFNVYILFLVWKSFHLLCKTMKNCFHSESSVHSPVLHSSFFICCLPTFTCAGYNLRTNFNLRNTEVEKMTDFMAKENKKSATFFKWTLIAV